MIKEIEKNSGYIVINVSYVKSLIFAIAVLVFASLSLLGYAYKFVTQIIELKRRWQHNKRLARKRALQLENENNAYTAHTNRWNDTVQSQGLNHGLQVLTAGHDSPVLSFDDKTLRKRGGGWNDTFQSQSFNHDSHSTTLQDDPSRISLSHDETTDQSVAQSPNKLRQDLYEFFTQYESAKSQEVNLKDEIADFNEGELIELKFIDYYRSIHHRNLLKLTLAMCHKLYSSSERLEIYRSLKQIFLAVLGAFINAGCVYLLGDENILDLNNALEIGEFAMYMRCLCESRRILGKQIGLRIVRYITGGDDADFSGKPGKKFERAYDQGDQISRWKYIIVLHDNGNHYFHAVLDSRKLYLFEDLNNPGMTVGAVDVLKELSETETLEYDQIVKIRFIPTGECPYRRIALFNFLMYNRLNNDVIVEFHDENANNKPLVDRHKHVDLKLFLKKFYGMAAGMIDGLSEIANDTDLDIGLQITSEYTSLIDYYREMLV